MEQTNLIINFNTYNMTQSKTIQHTGKQTGVAISFLLNKEVQSEHVFNRFTIYAKDSHNNEIRLKYNDQNHMFVWQGLGGWGRNKDITEVIDIFVNRVYTLLDKDHKSLHFGGFIDQFTF